MKVNCIMYNVQDYRVLYNNAVRPVIWGLVFFSHVESNCM